MKICLTNKHGTWSNAHSGKGKFAQRLIPALYKLGVEVTQNPDENVDIDLQFGKWQYKPHFARKKVLRLGPAHISVDQNYKKLNRIKWDSLKKCDAVIYQSQYSRKVCRKFIGKPNIPEAVIFNGADPEYYAQFEPYESKFKYNFLASTRVWLPQKNLKGIIRSFLLADLADSCLLVNGDTQGIEKKYQNCDNIMFFGPATDKVLARMYKLATALIHIVMLDACPNSVVEAMCAGCPVISGNQGGTPELVEGYGTIVQLFKEYDFKPINLGKRPKFDERLLARLINVAE